MSSLELPDMKVPDRVDGKGAETPAFGLPLCAGLPFLRRTVQWLPLASNALQWHAPPGLGPVRSLARGRDQIRLHQGRGTSHAKTVTIEQGQDHKYQKVDVTNGKDIGVPASAPPVSTPAAIGIAITL